MVVGEGVAVGVRVAVGRDVIVSVGDWVGVQVCGTLKGVREETTTDGWQMVLWLF